MKKKTLVSWSSGKDSAWALYRLMQDPDIELVGLFTVMNEKYDRASMHATHHDLLKRQARAIGLPIQTINLPDVCSIELCNEIMGVFVEQAVADGIECMAFGDLFLEDIREYREKQLKGIPIKPLFPVWGVPTKELAEQMLLGGLEAYVSCVDLKQVPVTFAGQRWSWEMIADFPLGADPCGENGEIHTIVVDGPMFQERVDVHIGEVVERDGFAFADIIPVG